MGVQLGCWCMYHKGWAANQPACSQCSQRFVSSSSSGNVNVDHDQVLTNIVGAIAESARTHENRELIREQEGLAPIIRLIASTSPGTRTKWWRRSHNQRLYWWNDYWLTTKYDVDEMTVDRTAGERCCRHRADGRGRGVSGAGNGVGQELGVG